MRILCWRASLSALILLFFPHQALAAPRDVAEEKGYRTIRQEYQTLKESDSQIKNLTEWEGVASHLRSFIEKFPNGKHAPQALLLLGNLYSQTYRVRGYRTGLSNAVFYYEQLAKNFPGHTLADDGLLALGDLRRKALKDETGARAAYYEIIDAYSKGDQVAMARERLGLDAKAKPQARPAEQTAQAQSAAPQKMAGPSATKTNVAPAAEDARTSLLSTDEQVASAGDMGIQAEERKDKSGIAGTLGELFGAKPESRQVYAVEKKLERPLVVIDPGHGGEDLGAQSPNGIYEKEVVLNISLYLEEMLRERLRARTVITRTTDIFVSLPDRTKRANDNSADLFISVHANASPKKNASGIETYYLENTDNQASLKLAERENQSLLFGDSARGHDLSLIFSDLIQNAKLDDSISLSHHVQTALSERLGRHYRDIRNLGVKKAPFYVLVGAHMPCALVEIGFLNHDTEGRRLEERRYQKLVAEALYVGVRSFFEAGRK